MLLGRAPNREFMLRTLLRRSDIELVAADGPHPGTPREFADEQLVVRTRNPRDVLECARHVHDRNPIHGVTTFAETLVVLTAQVCAELGLPGLSVDSAIACTNKAVMRKALASAGVPCPKFVEVRSVSEARAAIEKTGLPAVLKPTDNHTSQGVIRVDDADDIEDAFAIAWRNSGNGCLLAEQFMSGPEVSVEAFVVGRQVEIAAITDKTTTPGPHFLEIGHSVPSQLPAEVQHQIRGLVRSAAAALNLSDCAVHAEIKVTEDGPKVVEIAGRLGGDFISNLVWYALGINLPSAAADVALGVKPDLRPTKQQGAAVSFATVPNNTVLRSKPLVPRELTLAPDIREIAVDFAPGQIISTQGADCVRVASVITAAPTPAQATLRAVQHLEKIRFEVDHV